MKWKDKSHERCFIYVKYDSLMNFLYLMIDFMFIIYLLDMF